MMPVKFRYRLEEREIEEALLDLNWRREGRFRTVNLWVLSILGIAVLAAYIKDPGQFFLFLLLLLIVLMLFYMAYGTAYARKRRAKKIASQEGEYRLEITDTYILPGEKGDKIKLSEGKLKFFCSEHVLVIRAGREVFTIPRRVMKEEELEAVKGIAGRYNSSFVNIVVGGVRVWKKK